MEKIVRKILNVNPKTMSDEERSAFIDEVVALAVNLLGKTNEFNIDMQSLSKLSDIDMTAYGINCSFDETTLFTTLNDLFFDLTAVAHRMCHYAQAFSVDKSKALYPEKKTDATYNRVGSLYEYFVRWEIPYFQSDVINEGFDAAKLKYPECYNLYNAINSYVELQPFEMAANKFSYNFVRYIIEQAKTLELSKNETKYVSFLEKSLSRYEGLYDLEIEKMRESCVDPEIIRYNQVFTKQFLKDIPWCSPGFYKFFIEKQPVTINKQDEMYMILTAVSMLFEMDYVKNNVNKFIDGLFRCDQTPERDELLIQTFVRTPYCLTEAQKEQFDQMLGTTQFYSKPVAFKELLSEKKRIMAIRESIEKGTFNVNVSMKIK